MDRAKVNYGKAGNTKWFQLIGVRLENCDVDPAYPNGDEVQVAEPWSPPELWRDLSVEVINCILNVIDGGIEGGSRYSAHKNAKARAGWKVVMRYTVGRKRKRKPKRLSGGGSRPAC